MMSFKLLALVALATTSVMGVPHFTWTHSSSVDVSTASPTISVTDLPTTIVNVTSTPIVTETGLSSIIPSIIPTDVPIVNLTTRQQGTVYTGDATFYTPGLGACGEMDGPNDFIAAASHILFDSFPGAGPNPNNNPICGRSITAHANGNSVTVKITDRCAGCQGEGDLDFSPAAFQQLAPLSVGRIQGMTWSFN